MSDHPVEPVSDVIAAAVDANVTEIRARAADAIIGPIPVKKTEEGSGRRASLLGYGPHTALVACLLGFGWLAGWYFSGDQPSYYVRKLWPLWTLAPQESVQHAETIPTSTTETRAAIAELAGRVEHLERETAAKLLQIYARFDRIEHQIAAPTAASLAATGAGKRAHGGHRDAFDPSQNPNAPGVPRPLGSLVPD